MYLVDFNSPDTPIKINNWLRNFIISGSSNGLLLLKYQYDPKLVLFNPSTRQHRVVPATLVDSLDHSHVEFELELYGLGYDSFLFDYKVIRIVQYGVNNEYQTEVKVYSLKSNSWRKIGDFPYCLQVKGNNYWGRQVNGVLHSIVAESNNLDLSVIVGFHVAEENFNLVPKPDFVENEEVEMSVDVLDRCLCLMCFHPGYTDIWMMKIYGVKKSWMKLLSISSPNIEAYVSLFPLGFSRSCDEVLFNLNESGIIWYDLRSKEIRNVEIYGLSKILRANVCVESLVPLDDYGEVTIAEHNKEKISQ